jgi:hypothetical protein
MSSITSSRVNAPDEWPLIVRPHTADFHSAFAALRDPISRDYYSRRVQQGKRHNQALIGVIVLLVQILAVRAEQFRLINDLRVIRSRETRSPAQPCCERFGLMQPPFSARKVRLPL